MLATVAFDEPSDIDYELFDKMRERLHVKKQTFRLSGVKYYFQNNFTACEILLTEREHPEEGPYALLGISKRSSRDPYDSSIGMNTAFCRACRSAFDNKE